MKDSNPTYPGMQYVTYNEVLEIANRLLYELGYTELGNASIQHAVAKVYHEMTRARTIWDGAPDDGD